MPSPLIVITGATAVGKSDLGLRLASLLDAEIVSADSRQIYHYMDVGTAKPRLDERAAVAHHLIDVVYPDELFSVVRFQEMASRTLGEIKSRGKRALLVGGSPHYVQAVVDRIRPATGDQLLRAWLERVDASGGQDRLSDWLRALDPPSWQAIDLRNRRRVLRAIEVTLANGRPFSTIGRLHELPLASLWIGLRRSRAEIHARIETRMDAMLEAGWIDEVAMLLAMGYAPTLPSMSATGYRHIADVLAGTHTLDEARVAIQHATHAFVRRQESWLRAEPRIHWLDADDPDLLDHAMALIAAADWDAEQAGTD